MVLCLVTDLRCFVKTDVENEIMCWRMFAHASNVLSIDVSCMIGVEL